MFRRKTPEERIKRAVLRSLRTHWRDIFKPEEERGIHDDWIVTDWSLTQESSPFGTELHIRMKPRERYKQQHKIEYGNSKASIKAVDLDG